MRLFASIAAFPLLLAAAIPAHAVSSSADAPHVHVQLVVPSPVLTLGKPAEAGLYFKIDAGWHVYWRNAGDAGEPPHMKWTLPDGITAGPLQFPAPKRLPLGPLMDFGYEDEVLFPFSVNVAQAAKTGPAVLHAKVDWLVCQASCIPGKAELEVSRDVSEHPGQAVPPTADAQLFKRLSGRLPKPLPAEAKAVFQPTKDGFRLTVDTGRIEQPFFRRIGITADLRREPQSNARRRTERTQLRGALKKRRRILAVVIQLQRAQGEVIGIARLDRDRACDGLLRVAEKLRVGGSEVDGEPRRGAERH